MESIQHSFTSSFTLEIHTVHFILYICSTVMTLRHDRDNLLKLKTSNAVRKKGDLNDFERGMGLDARRAGLSIRKC